MHCLIRCRPNSFATKLPISSKLSSLLPFRMSAAAVVTPPPSPRGCCEGSQTQCFCPYDMVDYVLPHGNTCDCPCMGCCIERFAAQRKVCRECGSEEPLDDNHLCADCDGHFTSDDDDDYDYYISRRNDDDDGAASRYSEDDHDGGDGCTCNRCGESYDPRDSDYGGMACSEGCFERWGEEY